MSDLHVDPEGPGGPSDPAHARSALARFSLLVCEIAFGVMIVVVTLEIVLRSVFSQSLHMADELAGYMLIVLAFMSLAACQLNGAFHRVELVQELLSPRAQAWSRVVFDLLGIAFAVVFLWQLARFEIASYRSGSVAPTLLGTPLWIPQAAMVLGLALFLAALVMTLGYHIRALSSSGRKDPSP